MESSLNGSVVPVPGVQTAGTSLAGATLGSRSRLTGCRDKLRVNGMAALHTDTLPENSRVAHVTRNLVKLGHSKRARAA
jgi:hypothetical protein